MRMPAVLAAAFVVAAPTVTPSQDTLYSGPQKGEKLVPFKVLGVYDDVAGKELDLVADAAGKPLLLVFVHKITRPAWGLTRAVTGYCNRRREDGMRAAIVWLDDDRSAAQEYLTRARRSLNVEVPLGISPDGGEGPGAYGLNRNVTLTVLVAKDGVVTANFALVQPSDQDAPRILGEVVKLIGGEVPDAAELAGRGRRGGREMDARLAQVLRRLASGEVPPGRVKTMAARIEEYVGADRARQRALGEIARRLVGRAGFDAQGTEVSRAQIRAWAKKYDGTDDEANSKKKVREF